MYLNIIAVLARIISIMCNCGCYVCCCSYYILMSSYIILYPYINPLTFITVYKTFTYTYKYIYILTCLRTYVCTYTYIPTYLHTCVSTWVRMYVHTYIHTSVHTSVRTYNVHNHNSHAVLSDWTCEKSADGFILPVARNGVVTHEAEFSTFTAGLLWADESTGNRWDGLSLDSLPMMVFDPCVILREILSSSVSMCLNVFC